MKTTGRVHGIISNIVIVKADGAVGQNEICYVYTGDTKMMAEVIKVIGDDAYVQVFDSTRGLKIGDRVEFEGHMLEATLAPGLLSRNYDGLQNDLEKMDGLFIARGSITEPIDYNAEWEFTPLAQAGDKVTAAGWLGEVKEQWVMHKIMVPFTMTDTYTVKSVAGAGKYKVTDTIAVLTDAEGHDHEVTMVQKWPVKQAIRCYTEKPRPSRAADRYVQSAGRRRYGFYPGAVRRRQDGLAARHFEAGRSRCHYHRGVRRTCQRGGRNLQGVPRTGRPPHGPQIDGTYHYYLQYVEYACRCA